MEFSKVSFGTNLASEEELSSGVSCPISPLWKNPSAEGGSVLPQADLEMQLAKCSGPNRSRDKAKREHSSPYRHPKRLAKEFNKKELQSDKSGGEIKTEDQVMSEEAFGASALAVFLLIQTP
jgi:hypothetical protein